MSEFYVSNVIITSVVVTVHILRHDTLTFTKPLFNDDVSLIHSTVVTIIKLYHIPDDENPPEKKQAVYLHLKHRGTFLHEFSRKLKGLLNLLF